MDPRNTSASNKKNVTLDKGALSGKTFMEHVVKKMSKCNPTKFGNTSIFLSVGKKSFLGGMSKLLQLYIGGVRRNDYSIT